MSCTNGEPGSSADGTDERCKALVQVLEFSERVLLIRGSNVERPELPKLTPAEREVADLAARGLSDRTIAGMRRCASRTVSNQLASIYHKLGVSGRRELRASLAGVRQKAPMIDTCPCPAPWPAVRGTPLDALPRQHVLCSPPLVSRLSCVHAIFAAVLSEAWTLLELIDDDGPSFLARVNDGRETAPQLSPREREIFALAAAGTSNKVISYSLGLSVSTVSTHLRRARQKPVAGQAELLLKRMGALTGARARDAC
jgi:DNA-binding CsgD family transcriptional regulator